MTNSIAFRLAIVAVLWITGALIVCGFLLARLFEAQVERAFERRLEVLVETLVAVVDVDPAGGGIVLRRQAGEPRFDQPYSGWYWEVTAPSGVVVRSRSLWDRTLESPAGPPPATPLLYRTVGPEARPLLAIERGIRLPGAEGLFRFAVAGDLAELEAQIVPFERTLAWALGVLWLGLLLAVAAQIVFALGPLARIRRALGDVRAGRTDRLEGRFPNEVQPLVAELNAHLGQIARVVERARGHVGNLAHALKTPLSVLANEAEGGGQLADTVRRQAAVMRRRIDHYLVRARTAATAGLIGARAPIGAVIEDLRRTLLKIHAERALRIGVEVPPGLVFRGDRQDLEEMIGNVLDNACKWARREIRVTVGAADGRVHVVVEDDGPGLPAERRSEALGRGRRLDEAVPGSGLGLAIVDEIAGLYGGSVTLGDSALGGLRVDLALPAAERAMAD